MLVLSVSLLSAACAPEASEFSYHRIIVADCYSADDNLRIEISGMTLAISPLAERDDSTALCYDEILEIPDKFTVSVEGRSTYRKSMTSEEGMVLLVSATRLERTMFVSPDQLLFD